MYHKLFHYFWHNVSFREIQDGCRNEVYSETDLYLGNKCLYIVLNVDSVEECVAVKCNE